eukprot:COSAG02_NODE_110_length_36062_cov_85.812106_33_plen_628_part_00
MARSEVGSGDALAAFVAVESLRAATHEQERIEALGLLIYSCAAGATEVDRLAQSTVATQGAVVPLLAPLLASGSLHQRKLAGNALLILCFKHSDNAALVGESSAIEAAVANVLAPTNSRPKSGATDESGLALIENDKELVRQISVGVLSNVAAFNPCSHVRLVECGAVQMAVSVLESLLVCKIDGAIRKEELHDKLIAWSVSLLHCLSDNRSVRPALIDAGAGAQLLRIAQSPRSGAHFPVSATFAVANLYSHAAEYSRGVVLAPPRSAVHIPETVLRQCVEALPAALRGEVHNGYYFMPDKVALGLRNLLSLSSACMMAANTCNSQRPPTIATDSSGSLLGVATAFARLHKQEDAGRLAAAKAGRITGSGIWSHAERARVAAAAASGPNVDAHWTIGVPVDAIRSTLIDAGALRSLALALSSVGPSSNTARQCGHPGQNTRSLNGFVDEQEEREASKLHRQTLVEATDAMYELVVGYRSLETDLLHLQCDGDACVVGLCLLATAIRPLLQSLRRLAWAKVGHWFSRPPLSLDLVELVIAALAELDFRSCQYKASDSSTERVGGATTEPSDSETETEATARSEIMVAASRLHDDAAAERYVCERVQEPGPDYWCSTRTSHHATKTWR